MNCFMRKPDFCLCENKGADQLCKNCTADQHLCFRHSDSTIFLLPKSTIFCDCTVRFVSDQAGNPEDWFSRVAAQIRISYDEYLFICFRLFLGRGC